jgi:small subunit ribosomal protein S20
MPIKKNAMKALRQNVKRAERNLIAKAEIRSLRIKFRKAIDDAKKSDAVEAAKVIGKKVDKAVSKKILKKNTAARIKSRMMKKVNAIK